MRDQHLRATAAERDLPTRPLRRRLLERAFIDSSVLPSLEMPAPWTGSTVDGDARARPVATLTAYAPLVSSPSNSASSLLPLAENASGTRPCDERADGDVRDLAHVRQPLGDASQI